MSAITRLAGWLRAQVAAGELAVEDAVFAAEQFFTLVQTRIVLRSRLRLGCSSPQAAEVVEAAVRMFLARYAVRRAAPIMLSPHVRRRAAPPPTSGQ